MYFIVFYFWVGACQGTDISMGLCKKDVTPLLTHWSYVFLALTHRYGIESSDWFKSFTNPSCHDCRMDIMS